MRRRECICASRRRGGLAAGGARPGMPAIGGHGRVAAAGSEHMAAGFRQDLNETGYVEVRHVLRVICWLTWVAMWLMAPLINGAGSIAATPPRSILVLNESSTIGPFYYA